ncbi:MAG: 16S rRNA (guanine(527)-N(7))-methyltransferase RsmG [Candidatus Hydrogenedentota bacterium]
MPYTIASDTLRALLAEDGVAVPDEAEARLAAYCALVREWNGFASLVSRRDAALLESDHIPDALSLAGYVRRYAGAGPWLDVGSGGGFPAVPVKIVVPEAPLVLIERNAKKVGFLRKVIGALGLEGVELRHGSYPEGARDIVPSVLTARAVENPGKLRRPWAEGVAGGAIFLCQSRVKWDDAHEMFHVEHVDDRWKTCRLRRGDLVIVRRA